ncbi:hypothetical protein [Clostridium sp. WB02_MRS01]|nr:hypothetical protein [Clostridium sp. WB02_MRS01]
MQTTYIIAYSIQVEKEEEKTAMGGGNSVIILVKPFDIMTLMLKH